MDTDTLTPPAPPPPVLEELPAPAPTPAPAPPAPSPVEETPSSSPVYGSPPPPPSPPPSSSPAQAPQLSLPSPPEMITGATAEPSPAKLNSPGKIVAMAVVPSLAVCVVVVSVLLWQWQKRRKISRSVQNDGDDGESSSSDGQHGNADLEKAVTGAGPRRFQYRELAAATSDFADEEKLGRGGFGNVYRGRLPGGGGNNGHQEVAIKKFAMDSLSQGRREFEAEVRIISQLRHRNLVQLHGWCDSRKGLLLVYELVSGGSLDKHIYSTYKLFTWPERYKIILGLGSALRYLHEEWEQCILHGDIKPSNIMVDSSYNTKLGDFGLARLVDHGKGWQATRSVLGTAGYIDPEFVNTRRPSTQSDVYSFGIVLLEIVCSKPPVILHEDVDEPSFLLLKWVWSLYSQNAVLDAADERLRRGDGAGVIDDWQMERVLVVGLWCAHPDLGERPSIARAMNVLQSEDAKLPDLWPQMYKDKKASPPPPLNVAAAPGHYGGVSGGTFSGSGVPTTSATTATTTRSSGSLTS